MNVLCAHAFQVQRVDGRRHLHVTAHARSRHHVVEPFGDVEHAAAVLHAECLERGGHRQADGGARTFRVGYHKARPHGIEPAVHAFHAGVERFEIDTYVRALFRGGSL